MNIALIAILVLQTETVQTEHFEVVTDCKDRPYLKEITDALEAGYAAMAAEYRDAMADKTRYRINLYSMPADYYDEDKKLNGGKLASNWAFASVDTGQAYIVVQPRQNVPLLDRTRAVIRHEVFHLIAFRHAARQGQAPDWLEEGLCERAAEVAHRAVGVDPLSTSIEHAHGVNRLKSQISQKKHIPLQDIFMMGAEDFPAWNEKEQWYDQAWLLVKYLAEARPDDWKKFRATNRQQGAAPLPDLPAQVRQQLLDQLGESVADLEKAWLAWVGTLKTAPWLRIAGDWRLTKDGVEGAAFADQSAYLVSSDTFKGKNYTVRAEAQLEKVGFGQVDVVVMPSSEGQDAANLMKVTVLKSGEASVLVRRNGKWSNVANERVGSYFDDPTKWVKLELQVNDRTVTVRIQGKTVLNHTLADESEKLHDIRWGVGNYDSWTKFRAIEIKKN